MDASSPNKFRHLANFHPTVWGYYFLSYTPEISNAQEKLELDEYKEIIKKMLVETTPENISTQKLVLIDTIQRLGVAYHFHNKIDTSIQNIFDTTISQLQSENIDDNLYVVSLRFQLLRQQGNYIHNEIDTSYDAYAMFDELVPFTDAIHRWDISVNDSLSPYMRPAYQALIDIYNEMEQLLAKEGKSDRVYYAKYEMKKLVRAYFKEAQWLYARYIPKCEEHMKNALVSCGYMMAATTSLIGIDEFISTETFELMINEPLIVRAASIINKGMDDISGHEDEQQRGHVRIWSVEAKGIY